MSEGKNQDGEAPKTVPRPAVPSDYLKARPRTYLNAVRGRARSHIPKSPPQLPQASPQTHLEAPETHIKTQAVSDSPKSSKRDKRAEKKAQKAAKKAERQRQEQILRSEFMLGDDTASHPEIEKIWQEQEAIRLADEKLEQEYRAAKERQKELKKRIKQHNLDGDNLNLKGVLGPDSYEKATEAAKKAGHLLKNVSKKAKPLVAKSKSALPVAHSKLRTHKKPALAVFGIVALAGVGLFIRSNNNTSDGGVQNGSKTEVAGASTAKPTFDVATRSDTPTDKVQFDPQRQVASFEVLLGDKTVTVSQQPLPESFKKDRAGSLKSLATDIYATKELAYDDGKAYLGQNIKGPQTVVAVKKDLLIFLASTGRVEENDWVELLNSLK